ncbi:O-fucosyltransferase 27-like [Actinidia eriantha]|uniref:O-fucosyltransferase 27-like n=1 Tax=Actinidia eriantha TaxID=165200 RepID=UPI0025833B38|nr:O-fucosyltransferase 27-like [Actinidia eriantha]
MKGEGKMVFKSKLKWVGVVGLALSIFSLFTHFLLSRYAVEGFSEYQASITIFFWRPIFENADLSTNTPLYRRLWGPVRQLESLYPHATPKGSYAAPILQTNGFVFVRIRGGFHEIRNSISDVVVVARLLNATLVIPEIQSTTSSKGISSEFKSFAYLYNEDQFIAALAKDVRIVKTLPKNLKGARRKKEIPLFKVSRSVSPYFYRRHVLPVLNRHSVVELVISDGGCLQAILPHHLEEYQRLRCRVAFHALRFRQEVQELATKILNRLRAPGRPFIAYDPGMSRDALAYYGCGELFQDVHTELIQHRRSWMIKRGFVKGNLTMNSAEQRLNGSCPLMPEEVGILLRAYGYSWDTIIYISGGEVFGGLKKLIPIHGMFENIVDRTSLSTAWELGKIYGREANLVDKYPRTSSFVKEEMKREAWKTSGPRPRPLPPPPARPKYPYNIEGWWGWVAESDNEPESTVMELRMNAHKLLWEAIDYTVCVEADVFVPGFDSDGKGRPNFASLVMGHRLYQSAASKTFRIDRREVIKLLDELRDHLYEANHTWITSVRRHLRKALLEGLTHESMRSKPLSFISHPFPECSCLSQGHTDTSFHASSPSSTHLRVQAARGVAHPCPAWMDGDKISQSIDKAREEDLDEDDDSSSAGLFFRYSGGSHGGGGGEINNKEEALMEDQEELEGAER